MIKGVFFDLGGTLYSYANPQATLTATVKRLAERFGLGHDAAELAQHFVQANRDVEKVFAEKPFFLVRDYIKAQFINFLDRIDHAHLAEHADWFHGDQLEAMLGMLTLKPDCQQTLARLKDMGLYLSIVSNIDDDMLGPLVERAELQRWLSHWTSSEAARSCKPDQRFFDIALEKSGLKPDQIVFVGDSPEQDILGAHIAGMGTVLIAESDQPAPMTVGKKVPEPDYRIGALAELPDIVANFQRRSR